MDMLYDRNRDFFRRHFPIVAAELDHLGSPVSQRIVVNGDDGDITTHGVPLYGMGARAYAQRQLEAIDGPDWTRIISTAPIPASFQSLLGQRDLPASPLRHQGFHLISLGLGLGLHLPLMAHATAARSLIIVEPNLEFLHHSLHVLDWETLAQQVKLHIITAAKPEQILDQLQRRLDQFGAGLTDGSFILCHYPDPLFRTVTGQFRHDPNSTLLCHGDIYDEIRMVRNSYLNLRRDDAVVWQGSAKPRNWPVMIVGSGPSLDGMLEDVRRLAPSCLVIAAGTALPVLLRNGIVPDFCTILENVSAQYDELVLYAQQAPQHIRQVVLLGSSTMDPRIIGLFDRTVLAIRSHVASAPLFGYEESITAFNLAPTVTNMALGLFLGRGYRDFILFGTDFGTKDPNSHHAKDAPQMRGEVPPTNQEMAFTVRGNLGGKVVCYYDLNWARTMIESVLDAHAAHRITVRVRNCSDGALIRGATPTLARKLTLPPPATDKAVALADFLNDFAPYGADQFARVWNPHHLLEALSQLDSGFTAALTDSAPFAPMEKISAILKSANVMAPLIQGSVNLQMIALNFIRNRLDDADQAVWNALLQSEQQLLSALIAEAQQFVRDLSNGAVRGPWLRLAGSGIPTEW